VATSAREQQPDIHATAPIDAIVRTFFKYDMVLVRKMIPPQRVDSFYRDFVAPIYADDSIKIRDNYNAFDDYERIQLKHGWLTEKRITRITNGAARFEDVLLSHTFTRLADRLMDTTSWADRGASLIRRVASTPDGQAGYLSAQAMHTESLQYPDDEFMLIFVAPFTEMGHLSPGLQSVLASTTQIKRHLEYNPETAFALTGQYETNSRMTFDRFSREEFDRAFTADRRWNPHMTPGDVLIFSSWAAYQTYYPPGAHDTSVALEYRVIINRPDTTARQRYTLE
jgi:hypothetical protein